MSGLEINRKYSVNDEEYFIEKLLGKERVDIRIWLREMVKNMY